MTKHHQILLGVLATLAIGCSSGTPITIPNVSISCPVGQAAECTTAADSSDLLIGFFTVNCATLLVDPLAYDPIRFWIGSTVSCNATLCTATVTTWLDENSTLTTMMTSGTYTLAAFIDSDNSGDPGTGDPYYCNTIAVDNSNTILLSTGWAGFP